MRRVVTLSVLSLSAGLLVGCDLKEVYPTAAQPLAGVRFINAVPDTAGAFGMDLRFVDILESNAHFRQGFRNVPVTSGGVTGSTGVQFKHARAGQRQFRIFLDDTIAALATTIIKDTTVTLVAGRNYTALLYGYANPGGPNRPAGAPTMKLDFFEETVADPGTGVAVRVINATHNALDVRQYPNGGVLPGAATWANMLPLTVSTHVTVVAPAQTRFNVQPAGGGTTPFADALTLIGAAASSSTGIAGAKLDIEALPGTSVAGSATTLIVFPQSIVELPRVAKFTTTTVANTQGRSLASVTALGGGLFRITSTGAPAWGVNAFAPTAFGYWTAVITPPTTVGTLPPVLLGIPPITVRIIANGANFVDTSTDLTAYLGASAWAPALGAFSVIGHLTAPSSIWDRRPAYIP